MVAPYNCVTVVFLVTHMVSGFLSYDTVQEGINKTIDHAGFSPYMEISGGPFKEHGIPKKFMPCILDPSVATCRMAPLIATEGRL